MGRVEESLAYFHPNFGSRLCACLPMLAYLFLPWDCLVQSRGPYRLGFLSGQISEAREGKGKESFQGMENACNPES